MIKLITYNTVQFMVQWRRHGMARGAVAPPPNPLQTRFSDSCKSGEKFEVGGVMISGVSQA